MLYCICLLQSWCFLLSNIINHLHWGSGRRVNEACRVWLSCLLCWVCERSWLSSMVKEVQLKCWLFTLLNHTAYSSSNKRCPAKSFQRGILSTLLPFCTVRSGIQALLVALCFRQEPAIRLAEALRSVLVPFSRASLLRTSRWRAMNLKYFPGYLRNF